MHTEVVAPSTLTCIFTNVLYSSVAVKAAMRCFRLRGHPVVDTKDGAIEHTSTCASLDLGHPLVHAPGPAVEEDKTGAVHILHTLGLGTPDRHRRLVAADLGGINGELRYVSFLEVLHPIWAGMGGRGNNGAPKVHVALIHTGIIGCNERERVAKGGGE